MTGASSSSSNAADPPEAHKAGGALSAFKSKNTLGLAAIVMLQIFSLFNFESSAGRLQEDLDASQARVLKLQARLSAVEKSAMTCYSRLNTTEQQVAKEAEVINDETKYLRNLTAREAAEESELKQLRAAVLELNATVLKNKIALRYEIEERRSAERAAQASQDGVQVIKDQLDNCQDEIKTSKERCNRDAAKAHRKLSKAEKKAKDEEKARAKYMEGMLNLQSKLGRTKSLLDSEAMRAVTPWAAGDAGEGR